jgi:hypothetical protein
MDSQAPQRSAEASKCPSDHAQIRIKAGSTHGKRQPQPPTISTKGEIAMKSTHSETQMHESVYNEEIRVRAYELFEQRGGEPGHDLDDWLQAEAEIVRPARSQLRGVAA